MAYNYWLQQESKFLKAIKEVDIPNKRLDMVDFVSVRTQDDLSSIPSGGGCYWIWTNEPVKHSLHKNPIPEGFGGGEIIYNGIAKDDVRRRVFHHLFGFFDADWSGMSIDIYTKQSLSHRKKACSKNGKVPFYGDKPIRERGQLLNLFLSNDERKYINNSPLDTFYFRNGINISEKKHQAFIYRVYYIVGLTSLYLEYIEKEWRKNGLPRLCSYLTGR